MEVRAESDGLSFRLPPHRFESAPEEAVLVAALGGAQAVAGTPRIVASTTLSAAAPTAAAVSGAMAPPGPSPDFDPFATICETRAPRRS